MALAFRRIMDFVYATVCCVQIFVAVLFDFQIILGKYYPKSLQNFFVNITTRAKDCIVLEPDGWLKCFIWMELLLITPYLPVAVYAFAKGLRKCAWIRIPSVIHATMMLTICVAMACEYYVSDFTGFSNPCPVTMSERLKVIAFAVPYIVFFGIMLVDMFVFATPTTGRKNEQSSKGSSNKKKTPAKKGQ